MGDSDAVDGGSWTGVTDIQSADDRRGGGDSERVNGNLVDVAQFERIRVVADERVGSGTGITVLLTITEGNELVAQLDVLHLTPHAQLTNVYEVPGTKLTISAETAPGVAGNDTLDVLVYGF